MNENRKTEANGHDRSQPERTHARATYAPRADIYETKDAVHLVADMPGVDENAVDITLEKNVLTITGRVTAPEIKGWRRIYSEIRDGDYSRSFQLSNEFDASNIKATVKNGVLRLSLPRHKPAQRKIPVMVG